MQAFTAKDLQVFYGVLDSVVSEVAEREIGLDVYVMIARLFSAAERGEKNPVGLRRAILLHNAGEGVELLPARRFGKAFGTCECAARSAQAA